MPRPFDVQGFIQSIIARGWRWGGAQGDLLVHPDDHEMCFRYDVASERLTVSPKLDAQLKLVIVTPGSKGRFRG